MKRALDLSLVVPGLIVVAPLLALIAAIIWIVDGRPIFFRQVRVGRHGVPFRLWKFRTMSPHGERMGPAITIGADTRITHTGRWLRATKLDELPQLFNVVCGEMSFVGPRPEVPCYVDQYTTEQRRILELVPGITDAASIEYRHESELLAALANPDVAYIQDIVPDKIRLSLEYAERANVWRDLQTIFRTISCIGR